MIFFDYNASIAFLESLLGTTNNVVDVKSESTFKVSNDSTTERQTMKYEHTANDADSSGNIFITLSTHCDKCFDLNERTACMTYFLYLSGKYELKTFFYNKVDVTTRIFTFEECYTVGLTTFIWRNF